MKKSKGNQTTLFQSWGHPQTSSRISTKGASKTQTKSGNFDSFDVDQLVTLEDDEDDDELLAAAAEIAPLNENCQETVYECGNSTTSTSNHILQSNSGEIEVLPGFDQEAGNVWIYPTNYPIRNYQYDIVEKALFKNTLVTLPTGLGKTFIAAVIMYNFYRWYPQGKVIFMAPTKPLVAQQIEACYNIMGIPQSDTAEMTGNMVPKKRQSLWQSRRVFYLTPQVLQNDLNRGSCVAEQVVLLVVDEAHKALGNHAYCQVIREVAGYTRRFRVLALSATPGDDLQAVQQVITNLLISHMELRTEDSPDIRPYTHSRQVDKVVVPLGEDISKVKRTYLKVLEGVVSRLVSRKALWQRDPQRVTKFQLLSARDQFRNKLNQQGGMDRSQAGLVEGDFAMCISLYHAYELLLQHGILSFYNFIKGIVDGTKGMARAKSEITRCHDFTALMAELREEIEPPVENTANASLLFSQFSPRRRALMNVPKPSASFKSHPKLLKLQDIILEHFAKYQDQESAPHGRVLATRVMIFSQYRDSVNEIAAMLAQHKPVVRVMSFIGQQSAGKSSRGLTQKEQLQVVQRFRQGGYNTLVATCVGEEGLDIGEVDLIICFDAHASPIRLVQRMGRTGRKRDGRIVILVTEGKEEQIYKKSQSKKNSIHKAVTQAAKSFDLYPDNPRMIPRHLTPTVLKMEMTVGKFIGHSKGNKKGRSSHGGNIRDFASKSAETMSKRSDGLLTYEELVYWQEHFKLANHGAGLSPQLSISQNSRRPLAETTAAPLSLTEWLPWQTTLHPVKAVSHSRRTEHLTALLEFTELYGNRADNDESSYDLEMMSFLNEEDILRPGQNDCQVANVIVHGGDVDIFGKERKVNVSNKKNKSRKKLDASVEPTARTSASDGSRQSNDRGGELKPGNADVIKRTSVRKNTKTVNKRFSKNKARWREILKELDKEDDDFVRNEDPCFSGLDNGESFQGDLPTTRQPSGAVTDALTAADEIMCLADNNEDRRSQVGAGHSKISKIASLYSTPFDELSDLLPPSTHYSVTSFPVVKALRSRSRMTQVPSPPPLESLNQISSSPGSVDFDDLERGTNGEQKNEWANLPSERTLPTLSAKVCSESHSQTEPFLMGDFIDDDDDEADENFGDNTSNNRLHDKEPSSIQTPGTERCIETGEKSYVHEDSRDDDSCIAEDNVEPHGLALGTNRMYCKGDLQKDFGAGIWCGSPPRKENENEHENCNDEGPLIPVEDPSFSEVFFIDETSDDALTDLTLLGEKNGCDVFEANPPMPTVDHSVLSACKTLRDESPDVKNAGRIWCDVDESGSKPFDKTVNSEISSKSKSSAFQHRSQESTNASDATNIEVSRTEMKEATLKYSSVSCDGKSPATTMKKTVTVDEKPTTFPTINVARNNRHSEAVAPTAPTRNVSEKNRDNRGVRERVCSADDSCRSPLPKKLKLSLKRTAPREAGIVIGVNNVKPANCEKQLTFGSRTSCGLIPMRRDSSSRNKLDESMAVLGGATKHGDSVTAAKRPSPKLPANLSKLRTQDGKVVAVMESDSDNEGDDITPVGKAVALRRRTLSSPSSQEFRGPAVFGEANTSKSKHVERKIKRQKRVSLEIGVKKSRDSHRKKAHNRVREHFLDDEAELSGSDIRDFSPDEEEDEDEDEDEMDSFIDDSTQLTQKTPCSKTRRASSPLDMQAVYRQSLMSPFCGALNFKTPLLHKQRNRYKMVYKSYDTIDDSLSEEGDAYERQSFVGNDTEGVDDYEMKGPETEQENEAHYTHGDENILKQSGESGRRHAESRADLSPEESQIGPPVKRMKRKRILNVSSDEEISPKFNKQRNVTENCDKENTVGSETQRLSSSSDIRTNGLLKSNAFGNFPPKPLSAGTSFHGDFVTSSEVFNDASKFPDRTAVACRSADRSRRPSMRRFRACHDDWDSSVSDTELLIALEDGETTSSENASVMASTSRAKKDFIDEDSDEIAAASDIRNDNVFIEMSELPTFTLHFDFLSDIIGTSTGDQQDTDTDQGSVRPNGKEDPLGQAVLQAGCHNKNNLAAFQRRDETGNIGCIYGEGKNVFTKVVQYPNETCKIFEQPPKDPQTIPHRQEKMPQCSSGFVKATEAVARKVSQPNILRGKPPHTALVSNKLKSTWQHTGQGSPTETNAPKPQQVVTPSCRTSCFGAKPLASPLLTSSLKDKGKTVILVDTREISSSQVVSLLRLKHHIKAEVCQLKGCDYIVSNRMAVKRKTVSDISNGANSQKLMDCVRLMCDLYDRPCLIVEKDRVKPGETEKNYAKSKAYVFTLASVAQTHVKMVFSDSQEETARLLTDLASIESKKGMSITAPTSLNPTCEKVLRVLLSFPRVSYITALNLCSTFNSLQEIVNSTPTDLQRRSNSLSSLLAAEIHRHLRHKFNPNIAAVKK